MQSDYLQHHGILGQKWGVRRFQNKDGSLTPAGKKKLYGKGADGGYESHRSRLKRSMDAAKYEKDIAKNQKKLDKATSKGDAAKIQKYSQIDKILKTNRDHMVKDLSPEMIKLGKDYIEINKATTIGTIIAGPLGGIGAGTAKMVSTKVRDTEREVQRQEAERKGAYNAEKKIAFENASREKADQAANEFHKNGVYTYEYTTSDGKRHVDPIKDEKTAKAILKDDAYKEQTKAINAAKDSNRNKSESSNDDPYSKENAKYFKPGTTEFKDIDSAAKYAKKTGAYNMEFIERNLDYDKNGEPLTGKELDAAYRKFLKEEW